MVEYVIDGSDRVLGRIGSYIAKELLNGNDIHLVNAEKIAISGSRKGLIAKYKQLVELKDKANPEHSPYWSRRPDLFVKRVIRGMLPYKMPRGKAAYKKLRVYVGFPEQLKKKQLRKIESKKPSEIYQNTMTISELSKDLGYNK